MDYMTIEDAKTILWLFIWLFIWAIAVLVGVVIAFAKANK